MPGFESLPLLVIVWIAFVLAFAGVVQGALGLGFPMLATPMIAAVTDMRTAVIVVLLPCVATTVTNIALTGQFLPTLRRFWFMPLCMLAGATIGARLFVAFPAFPFALLLASVIVLYLYLDHLGRVEWAFVSRHPVASGAGFALLAGLSEGSANIAAPPLLMYLFSLNLDRTVFVQWCLRWKAASPGRNGPRRCPLPLSPPPPPSSASAIVSVSTPKPTAAGYCDCCLSLRWYWSYNMLLALYSDATC
jgi:Sulfite exporter TauE/SafE